MLSDPPSIDENKDDDLATQAVEAAAHTIAAVTQQSETSSQAIRSLDGLYNDTQLLLPTSPFTFELQLKARLGDKTIYSDFREDEVFTLSLDEIKDWLKEQQEAREPKGQRMRRRGILGYIRFNSSIRAIE